MNALAKYGLALFMALLTGIAGTADAAIKPQHSQAHATQSSLDMRIQQLLPLLKNRIKSVDYFTPTFLAAVPEAQIKSIMAGLINQYGQPLKIGDITIKNPQSAIVKIVYQKAIATIQLVIEPAASNKVSGLLISDILVKNDGLAKIKSEFAALHGQSGFLVQTLESGAESKIIESQNADQIFAIGSTFKLYILAELTDEINAGTRKWSDVVPLSQRSFSSQATKDWPKNSPVTLQTLATWMISVSDNSAADSLLHVLGRSAVEQKLAMIGHSAPDKILPFLSTIEAFALKSPANATLRQRFNTASEDDQRMMLDTEAAHLGYENVDSAAFNNGPAFIDSLEWFASPQDIVRLLDHIRRANNETTLQIMAVNSGIPAGNKKAWQYLGYKGGSEPGVMSMSFLAQSKTGNWLVISGSWNDPQKALDEEQFAALMERLVKAIAQ